MVAVFHRIGEPTPDLFTHSIKQIRSYEGKVSFDGVYSSVYDHIEELPKQCLLFVSGDMIGTEGFCTQSQLEELRAHGHMLAWHGWSHRKLTELSEDEIRLELTRPEGILPYYAYPHGEFNDQAIHILQDMGYRFAYSTTQGIIHNPYAIPRHYI